VIDPESFDKNYGNVYAPSGARGVNETANGMCGFDLRYYGFKLLSMPPGPLPINVAGFSFVYCTQRKSMMLYGGHGEIGTSSPYLFEYLPIEAVWTFLVSVLVLSILLMRGMIKMRESVELLGWLFKF